MYVSGRFMDINQENQDNQIASCCFLGLLPDQIKKWEQTKLKNEERNAKVLQVFFQYSRLFASMSYLYVVNVRFGVPTYIRNGDFHVTKDIHKSITLITSLHLFFYFHSLHILSIQNLIYPSWCSHLEIWPPMSQNGSLINGNINRPIW